jgi:photosystem II stability/assembly factor-like uncharacterized protein
VTTVEVTPPPPEKAPPPAPAASVAAPAPLAPTAPGFSAGNAPDAPVLAISDGPAGAWTGEHGNLPRPLQQIWGAGDEVFAVVGGFLIHSSDGGLTWWRAGVPEGVVLASVWGTGPDEVYAGGKGTVLRSTDRGRTWTRLSMPVDVFYAALWGDGKDAYAAGSDGVVCHSKDHGASWEVQAKDLKLGWLHAAWGRGKDVWVVGGRAATSGAAMIHTSDGGKHWSLVSIQASPLRSICGTGDGSMYAIDATGSIHTSTDQGRTWRLLRKVGNLELTALACTGKSEVYVGGRNRTFQHSTDGGKTWVDELTAQSKWTRVAHSTVDAIWPVPGGPVYAGGEGIYEPDPTGTLFRRR